MKLQNIEINYAFAILLKYGIKPTKQRLLIVKEVFSNSPKHFTAQDIYKKIIEKKKKVALSSVYNTLRKLINAGGLQEIYIQSNKSFFDTITEPHFHFYDKSLDYLEDIPVESVEFSNFPELPKGKKLGQIRLVINIENHSK